MSNFDADLSMQKIKVSIVSYVNTIPFVYGLEKNESLLKKMELYKDIPSVCAQKLINEDVHVGLIPVASIPKVKNAQIVSKYGIAADGPVHSVLLCSTVPLEQIEKIYLDYQSRTSVALCQILCKEHWNISPEFIPAMPGYENEIKGNDAAIIIGDRTFHLSDAIKFRYDLSEAWKELTGLAFIFAAWVSNTALPKAFIEEFNMALESGLKHIDEAISASEKENINEERLNKYLKEDIHYELSSSQLEGLNLFLEKLKSI